MTNTNSIGASPSQALLVPDLAAFLVELTRQEAAAKTITNYRSDLVCFGRWLVQTTGEHFAAEAITPSDLRDYRQHLLTIERRKPATINRRLAALRRFCAWATATKRIPENPTDQVKGITTVPTAPKSLEKRELDRLLRVAERAGNKRNLAILHVLRHTGLRVSEVCALRLDELNVSERKGSVTVRSGKGVKHRVVPLNADARRALTDYLAIRPTITDDHLFLGQRGEGLKPQGVEIMVKQYARLAGLDGVSPHTLRHTFAKTALDSGTDLVTVATLMGHERLETTAIYTKPSDRDLERAVACLEVDYPQMKS
jgi:site-specific recombinase XerD